MTAPLPETIMVAERGRIYRVVTDMDALHEAFRDRVEDMNVSRIEFDALAQFTPGYASKTLCDPPMKYVGKETLPKMLKGTRLAIALIEYEGNEPPPATSKRKYTLGRISANAPSMPDETQVKPINTEELVKTAMQSRMREIGMMGNKSSKRQQKAMAKRARQRKASHAARMRWGKRHA